MDRNDQCFGGSQLYALALLAGLVGCGAPSDAETTGKTASKLVGGTDDPVALSVTPYNGPNSAETATIVNYQNHVVVAFNYDDPTHISYTPTTRTVSAGASMMGWSITSAPGYPDNAFNTPGRVPAPSGWPVLWGDPGLGQIPGTGYVYLTNLAVPQSKMPPGGISGGFDESVLGGACIARSTDGGQSFTLSANDCVNNSSAFYDGSDVTGTPNGGVFAAFRNVGNNSIDVWYASSATGTFALLQDTPFPGKTITTHPRLRSYGGGVLVLAGDSSGDLWLNYYNNGWQTGQMNPAGTFSLWPRIVDSFDESDVNIGGTTIRRAGGAQFDMAIKTIFGEEDASTRVVYSQNNGTGHAIMTISECILNDTTPWYDSCGRYWTVDPGTNVFHPAIEFREIVSQGYAGSWKVTWQQQTASGGTQVALYSGSLPLDIGQPMSNVRAETPPQVPCPDARGYWGDYDAHMGIYQPDASSGPLFWRGFADSTDWDGNSQCFNRWTYWSNPVAVSATWISYP